MLVKRLGMDWGFLVGIEQNIEFIFAAIAFAIGAYLIIFFPALPPYSFFDIKVKGKRVMVKINDTIVIDYTEPENPLREEGSQRLISNGTFALQLQADDPGAKYILRISR